MEKNQTAKEYPQTWNNLVLKWNPDFFNHLGKSWLVRVIGRIEISRDKIAVLYLTAMLMEVKFGSCYPGILESQKFKKLGFYCLRKYDPKCKLYWLYSPC